jgi:hypothetical protein
MPPATAPLRRTPFDLSVLPPELQAQLQSGQTVTLDDGSVVYPDGTAQGAGDSPDDFATSPEDVPLPPPPPDVVAQMMAELAGGPAPLPSAPVDPFAGRQFDRHFAVRDAGPLLFGDEEASNPMQDALPDPFETPQPARPPLQVNANPLSAANPIAMRKKSMSRPAALPRAPLTRPQLPYSR